MDKKDFCCNDMYEAIVDDKTIDYDMVDRTYGILFGKFADKSFINLLQYCPWCGAKLKERLHKQIYVTLEQEYGIKHPDLLTYEGVPNEFKTDEWWKKRGL